MGHDGDVYLMEPHIEQMHLIETRRQIVHGSVQTSQ